MIEFAKLKKEDLTFYKGKKVFLYGAYRNPFLFYKIFRLLNIEMIGYSVLEGEQPPSRMQIIKNNLRGLRYIKSVDLNAFLAKQKKSDLIVQPIGARAETFEKIELDLLKWDVQKSSFLSGEIVGALSPLVELRELKSTVWFVWKKMRFCIKAEVPHHIKISWEKFCGTKCKNAVVVCSPMKTADFVMNFTFDQLRKKHAVNDHVNPHFFYVNLWHRPECINRLQAENKHKPFKIILGIREPISQNLSFLYQRLAAEASIKDVFYQELFETDPKVSKNELFRKYEIFFSQGINVQAYWNIYMRLYVNKKKTSSYRVGFIQNFIPVFKKSVLDITEYPFDQEKGYTIIKDGNTEVFVYQLEKLNNLVPELSEWVGVPFDKLEKGNQASDKWIAESYKQAQKEIEITPEYFDKCFDEPYVKHCYSEADIENFKTRWRPHIKKDAQ